MSSVPGIGRVRAIFRLSAMPLPLVGVASRRRAMILVSYVGPRLVVFVRNACRMEGVAALRAIRDFESHESSDRISWRRTGRHPQRSPTRPYALFLQSSGLWYRLVIRLPPIAKIPFDWYLWIRRCALLRVGTTLQHHHPQNSLPSMAITAERNRPKSPATDMDIDRLQSTLEAQINELLFPHAGNTTDCGQLYTTSYSGNHTPSSSCRQETNADEVDPATRDCDEQCKELVLYRQNHETSTDESPSKVEERAAEKAAKPALLDWIAWDCDFRNLEMAESKLFNRYKHVLHEDPDYSHMTATFRHAKAETGDLKAQGQELKEKREVFLARTKLPYAARLSFARDDLDRMARTHTVHDAYGLCCDPKHKRVVGAGFIWTDESDEDSDDDDDDDDWD
ncbi:hypothetical protein EJ03DRAFT_122042 [Teratosphaeria nubilosa]|uniref:Uncharacterized protein n=1 Tax=Teratosphaeria nubilosa TaxID=161662 RepID=A0A6G1L615_9PEZI|nr:hypothetical protein EJ03DRAFT_122042 [Teratosphaeria nubilosa]